MINLSVLDVIIKTIIYAEQIKMDTELTLPEPRLSTSNNY